MRIRASMVVFGMTLAGLGCNDRNPGTDAGSCTASGAENTVAACTDGMDNDCNGHGDCNDFACCSLVTCGADTTCGGAPQDAGTCVPTLPVGTRETSAADCADGVDNDCNGFTDCRDFSCGGICGTENSNARCNDGMDNDMDGRIDCMDFDCRGNGTDDNPGVKVCTGEVTNLACSDGMDNDGDGMTDCADTDCIDEGVVVCDSLNTPSAIFGDASMWAAAVETACTNGVEDADDTDMLFDCGEFSCLWNRSSCARVFEGFSNAECSDGIDNDMDGIVDCAEAECQGEAMVVCNGSVPADPLPTPDMFQALANARCDDDVNNDTNDEDTPRIDCADFDCTRCPDVTVCTDAENTNERCSDGVSNDGDEYVDCRDIDCRQNRFVTVCESSYEACSDGMDNDGDGIPDCADFDCTPMMGPPNPACL